MGKINKIVELQVEVDDQEFDDVGIEIMSLVEEPAIGVHWAVFAAQQLAEEDNDKAMVDGIIDLLNKVDSLDNRLEMAYDVTKSFVDEGIEFDMKDFMTRIGIESFEVNTDALPPYVDQTTPTEEDIERLREKVLEMASRSDVGEVLDVELTTYVNLSKTNFETIGEFLRGVDAIDVLGQIADSGAQQVPQPSYRYTGPAPQRNFCRALMALGKIYTRQEITAMNAINGGFAEEGQFSYSVFDYAGGVNCTHYWEQLRVFRGAGGRNIVISEGPAEGDAGKSQNSSEPSPTGYIRNNARVNFNKEWAFAEDDDKRVITGPAMKAFQMIPRRDEKGALFHVYFTDETIKRLSEKFLRDNKQHMTDIDHSMEATEENTLVESWIVEDPTMDKARALGFNPSKGDWYVSYRINNDETWKLIKEGKLNGFSIAGQFIERNTK